MASGSEKQQEQRERSWKIFRLRGLYYQCKYLVDDALPFIDAALVKLGAEPESERQKKTLGRIRKLPLKENKYS